MRPFYLSLPVLTALACQGRVVPLEACSEGECMAVWLDIHSSDPPPMLATAIGEISDPIKREEAVKVFFQVDGNRAAALCDALQEPARGVCTRLKERPHLYRSPTPPPTDLGAPGETPADARAAPQWAGPTLDATPYDARAAVAADPVAREAARECLAMEDGKWKDECYFHTAEQGLVLARAETFPVSTSLCLAAGQFTYDCLFHLVSRVTGQVTPDRIFDESTWRAARLCADRFDAALRPDHPLLARRTTDLLWSRVVDQAFDGMVRPTGLPLDWAGEEVRPAIRAAIARSLWEDRVSRGGLPAWTDAVLAVETSRDVVLLRTEVPAHDNRPAWTSSLPGEEVIPDVTWFGQVARRARAEDPAADAAICVLEIAARCGGPDREGVFHDALRHPDRLVRWTAARLAGELHPTLAEGIVPIDDPDPLVRARLDVLHPQGPKASRSQPASDDTPAAPQKAAPDTSHRRRQPPVPRPEGT